VVDGRVEPHVGLADAHARAPEREALEQRLGDRSRKRLKKGEPPAVGDRAHTRDDVAVVDGVGERVRARACIVDDEVDVEQEPLPALPFLLPDAVMPEELEAVDLDYDVARAVTSSTARAPARASTCGRTSCTRKRDAPRS
jgi:hypothetical protein